MANIVQLVKYLNNMHSSEEKIKFPLYEYYIWSFEVLASEVRKCVLGEGCRVKLTIIELNWKETVWLALVEEKKINTEHPYNLQKIWLNIAQQGC